MHPKRTARRLLPWAMILTLGLAGLTNGRTQPPDPKADLKNAAAGHGRQDRRAGRPARRVRAASTRSSADRPTDIVVSREDVLGVRLDPNNPNQLLLTGKAGGVSQITFDLKDRPAVKFDVVVQPDLALLRNVIKRTVPTANVDVHPGHRQRRSS